MNEDKLISVSVLEEIISDGFAGCGQCNVQVVVYQYRFFTVNIIVFRFYMKPFKALMTEETLEGHFGFAGERLSDRFHQRGSVAMINQRINTGKSMSGYQFF
jgi:hypothetical protein